MCNSHTFRFTTVQKRLRCLRGVRRRISRSRARMSPPHSGNVWQKRYVRLARASCPSSVAGQAPPSSRTTSHFVISYLSSSQRLLPQRPQTSAPEFASRNGPAIVGPPCSDQTCPSRPNPSHPASFLDTSDCRVIPSATAIATSLLGGIPYRSRFSASSAVGSTSNARGTVSARE